MPPSPTSTHLRLGPAVGLFLASLAACGSDPPAGEALTGPEPASLAKTRDRERSGGVVRGSQIELGSAPELEEIAQLEYQRSIGGGRLLTLLEHGDDRIRLRAVRACGRLPYPEFGADVTNALAKHLEDPVAEVRRAAAFALGIRRDPNGAGVLAAYRNDLDPELRARVVEAASRMDDDRLHVELLIALRDKDPRVKIEAAIAAARWDPDAESAETVDRALLDALRPYRLRPESQTSTGPQIEPEFVWRVLYALSRRRAELGRGAFLEYAQAPGALERLFAVRGLARIQPDAEVSAALARALRDEDSDWRTAYEAAVGLGMGADPQALPALLEAVEHPNAHVRAAAMGALGSFPDKRDDLLSKLRRGTLDTSSEVRVQALLSLVELLSPGDALEILREQSKADDAVMRAGVAEAGRSLAEAQITPILFRLARDPDLRVATRAVESLAGHPGPETREFLHAVLEAPDNGLRLAAILALREMPDARDREPLERAFRSSKGDISTEVAFNALENLGLIGDQAARDFLRSALADERAHVRRVARRVLAETFGDAAETPTRQVLGVAAEVPKPGQAYPRYKFNPLIEIVTSRGSLVFELFPAEAPVHVHNFVQLARNGHYDGLSFHRVVPDFVVQGGDYRGDGNGASPWNGHFLPHEFTERKTIRGSLGMPRNEDPESGGSQFFVTHRPTPHLDGRYTIFGELRQGGEVLDRLEVGDRILKIRPLR